jgi:hypothetical protein
MGHFFGLIIRAYTAFLAILVMLADLEWRKLLTILEFLEGFIGRGCLMLLYVSIHDLELTLWKCRKFDIVCLGGNGDHYRRLA